MFGDHARQVVAIAEDLCDNPLVDNVLSRPVSARGNCRWQLVRAFRESVLVGRPRLKSRVHRASMAAAVISADIA